MEERYIENTKQALDFGIFGVPSFSFSNEIFWGDDRLEDAIRLAPQK
jgi:2-hydroxychromene-2-carboxylate isomerase